MQIAQTTLKHHVNNGMADFDRLARNLVRLLVWLFGCWHREMSRPFTLDCNTYRVCLDCGARRAFDPERWEMVGAYYYGLPSASALRVVKNRARRRDETAPQIKMAA
ncbi:MAG TPA: hypothetical protein VE842_09325 [Pyrinomonadaceae bacterium]|jgi:hypothetical protein|nr:hypothetical protein [Pyrinomonadaceae bacterium]